MKINVRLHATLRKITADGPQNRLAVDLPDNATVAHLLHALDIDASPEHVMVVLGNRRIGPDHPLNGDDEIQLFPPISGGKVAAY